MLLNEVGTFLQSAGYGTLGTSLFLSFLPDSPDSATVVYESPASSPPVEILGPNLPPIERPRIQVVVRNADYQAGRSTADAIWKSLAAVMDQTLSGVYYHRIEPMGSPFPLKRDDIQREYLAMNLQVWKALS